MLSFYHNATAGLGTDIASSIRLVALGCVILVVLRADEAPMARQWQLGTVLKGRSVESLQVIINDVLVPGIESKLKSCKST